MSFREESGSTAWVRPAAKTAASKKPAIEAFIGLLFPSLELSKFKHNHCQPHIKTFERQKNLVNGMPVLHHITVKSHQGFCLFSNKQCFTDNMGRPCIRQLLVQCR
jgi:hypothetical protein